jgi:hypothetical protein
VVLADGTIVRVPRPPVGVLLAAAYLALWGLTLVVLSIFTLVNAISPMHDLTFENLVIGFGGTPVFHLLGTCLLVAGYGFATGRHWATWITRLAVGSAIVLLTGILLLGVQSLAEAVLFELNLPGLAWVFWYAGRKETRRFLAGAVVRFGSP